MSFNLTITHNPHSPLGDQYDVWLVGHKLFSFAVDDKTKPQGDYFCFSFGGHGQIELLCPSGWMPVPSGPINAPYLLFPLHTINSAAQQIAFSLFPDMPHTQIVADPGGFAVEVAGKTQLRFIQSGRGYMITNADMAYVVVLGLSVGQPFAFDVSGSSSSTVAYFNEDDAKALTPILLMVWRAFVASQK